MAILIIAFNLLSFESAFRQTPYHAGACSNCFSLSGLDMVQFLAKRYFLYRRQATCILKFVQRHFIASKLNAECGGYLDKIYKILDDILDLKAGFLLVNFFIRSNFFRSKTIKQDWIFLFLLRKKSLTNENSAKSRVVQKYSQVENRPKGPS